MRLLVISNGHGEDLIGARLAGGLERELPWLELEALPLVGLGRSYEAAGLTVVGPRQALPSGGLTLHHARLLLADLAAGLLPLTFAQIRFLRRAEPAAVLVVGDAYAQALAHFVAAPRRVLQPLVSIHQSYDLDGRRLSGTLWHRTFMERIRAPERWLLARADKVYTRDLETAVELRSRGVERAEALGNPVMDDLEAAPMEISTLLPAPAAAEEALVVGLLPGSRSYAVRSLALMLQGLTVMASRRGAQGPVLGLAAWAPDELPAPPDGWHETEPPAEPGVVAAWRAASSGATVWFVKQRLAAVLATSRLVLGTAGTANEQAAGLGLPVISFAVKPEYGPAFLANQERLLGGAMRVVDAAPEALADALEDALPGSAHSETASRQGPLRMGPAGGSAALVADLGDWLRALHLGQ